MLTSDIADLRLLEAQGAALARRESLGKAEGPWLASIEALKPAVSISTADCAENERYLKGKDHEKPFKFTHAKTPYVRGIEDACDEPGVGVVAVKGPARSGKTTAAENKVFRNWRYGPSLDVIWYMQTKDDVEEYCEERLEPMLQMHESINQHVNWNDRRHRLTRKRIRGSLARFLAATRSTLRGKAAPIIVGDEIDGYSKQVRKGFLVMAKNRQREFGVGSQLYLCSHPDQGPKDGIDAVLAQSLLHLWNWNCIHCHKASSPAAEAEVRMNWNVAQLLEGTEDMDLQAILDMVEREVVLVCPHCQGHIGEKDRLKMSNRGTWLQPQQKLTEDGEIIGDRTTAKIMGFVIHAFMSPFVTIGELAREYVAAKINAEQTQDPTELKEVVCKSLGETFAGAKDEEQMENWKVVQSRLTSHYTLGTVPAGVRYLTAFVDVQGDRFEVVVIGRGAAKESWLVDRFSLKQWKSFQNIDPANRLADWDIIEQAVLEQSWPLASNEERKKAGMPELYLGVAKTVVDAHGVPGVHDNALHWMAKITNPKRAKYPEARLVNDVPTRVRMQPVELYRVQLTKGDAHKTGDPIRPPRKMLKDDKGRELANQVYERTFNGHHYKLVLARRMKIAEPGPGRMHLPSNLPARYVRELTSETLVNGTWVPSGRNETWDGWVGSEVADELLKPDRPGIDWINDPPVWATPAPRGTADEPNGVVAPTPISRYDRLLQASGVSDNGELDDGDL